MWVCNMVIACLESCLLGSNEPWFLVLGWISLVVNKTPAAVQSRPQLVHCWSGPQIKTYSVTAVES